ncbi:MAG: hypothetical protein J6B80_06050 [Clostridia bacterium]|nr:hypothetical protein [Clostridia bacterium]
MIILKPTQDKNLIKKYYDKENISFSEFSNLLLATDREEVLGFCLFDIDDVLTVYKIEPMNDLPLLDGVLRSTLHVGCERGKTDAFYTETAPEAIFESLGFVKNKSERRLDVDKLFKSCCDCK